MLQLFSCLKALWPCVHISCVHSYTHWIIKLLWQIYLSANFHVVCMASLTICRTRGGRTWLEERENTFAQQFMHWNYRDVYLGCVTVWRHKFPPHSQYIYPQYTEISLLLCAFETPERGGKKRELAQRDASLVFVLHCSTVLNCAQGTKKGEEEEKINRGFFPSSLHWTLNMPSDIKTLRRRDKSVISSGRHHQASASRVSLLDINSSLS